MYSNRCALRACCCRTATLVGLPVSPSHGPRIVEHATSSPPAGGMYAATQDGYYSTIVIAEQHYVLTRGMSLDWLL